MVTRKNSGKHRFSVDLCANCYQREIQEQDSIGAD